MKLAGLDAELGAKDQLLVHHLRAVLGLEDLARETVAFYGRDAPKMLLRRADIADEYGDGAMAKQWREIASRRGLSVLRNAYPACVREEASAATKPRYGNMDDRRSVVLSAERCAAMPRQPEERALRYHNYAAFLRLVAERTQAETARARLRTLADQFDHLAESIHRATLAA
jgi:hypothetical protein